MGGRRNSEVGKRKKGGGGGPWEARGEETDRGLAGRKIGWWEGGGRGQGT